MEPRHGHFCSPVGKMGVEWVRSVMVKQSQRIQVLRMKFSVVENVPTSNDTIVRLSPASQLPYNTNRMFMFKDCWYNISIFSLRAPMAYLLSVTDQVDKKKEPCMEMAGMVKTW